MSDFARTAIHEASHLVVALGFGMPVLEATVVPDDRLAGRVTLAGPPDDECLRERAALTDAERAEVATVEAMWAIAGEIGEELGGFLPGAGCRLDWGDTEDAIDDISTHSPIYPTIWRRLLREVCTHYLRENWTAVRALAAALLSEGTLSGARARELVADLPAPDLRNLRGAMSYWAERRGALGRARSREATT